MYIILKNDYLSLEEALKKGKVSGKSMEAALIDTPKLDDAI